MTRAGAKRDARAFAAAHAQREDDRLTAAGLERVAFCFHDKKNGDAFATARAYRRDTQKKVGEQLNKSCLGQDLVIDFGRWPATSTASQWHGSLKDHTSVKVMAKLFAWLCLQVNPWSCSLTPSANADGSWTGKRCPSCLHRCISSMPKRKRWSRWGRKEPYWSKRMAVRQENASVHVRLDKWSLPGATLHNHQLDTRPR